MDPIDHTVDAVAGDEAGQTEHVSELPADEFPRLHAVAGHFDEHLSDEAFELGLQAILAGIEELATSTD